MEKITVFLQKYATIITKVYLILIIVILPFYAPNGYEGIGTQKFMFFKMISLMSFGMLFPAIVFRIGKEKKNCIRSFSITDISILLYGLSVVLSFAYTEWKSIALWGADGWYMGAVTQLFLVLIYFVVSRYTEKVDVWFMLAVGVSAIVFFHGLLNRFSIYPIQMKGANPDFISTLGNINWFCSYWIVIFPIGLVAYWIGWNDRSVIKKTLLIGYILIGFMTGIVQGSDSGFFALFGLGFTMFVLSFRDKNKILRWFELLVLFAISGFVLSLLINWFPGRLNYRNELVDIMTQYKNALAFLIVVILCYSLLRFSIKHGYIKQKGLLTLRNIIITITVFSSLGIIILMLYYSGHSDRISRSALAEKLIIDADWGNGRGTTWSVGVKSFLSMSFANRMVGIGPDCFYIYVYSKQEMAETLFETFGNARLTNAHNEWLTILINTGLFGMLTYVMSFISSIKRQLQGGRKNELIFVGGFCIIAYTVHNMVSFQQVMCTPLIFIIMGLGERLLREKKKEDIP